MIDQTSKESTPERVKPTGKEVIIAGLKLVGWLIVCFIAYDIWQKSR